MNAIKSARKSAGYTQQQVTDMTGIPLGTLRRWEQGVNEPDIDSIILLADFYGVSTDKLLGSSFSVEYNNMPLTENEQHLLSMYRSCSPKGREYLIGVADVTARIMGGD